MKCSKGVFGAGQACQAMGNLYHDACFTCAACSKCVREVWAGGAEDRGDQEREERQELPSQSHLALGPRKGRTVSSRAGFHATNTGPVRVR